MGSIPLTARPVIRLRGDFGTLPVLKVITVDLILIPLEPRKSVRNDPSQAQAAQHDSWPIYLLDYGTTSIFEKI
jgi:hypothetical protein